MCQKCFESLEVTFVQTKIHGVKVTSVYGYNEAMKGLIYTLKGLGDIVLAPLFLERYLVYFKSKYHGYHLLAAPSSSESDNIRGFNHVVEIYRDLNLPFLHVISKKSDYKQSDLSFQERQEVANKLRILNGETLTGKKILIVDDIKTTGATIKAMIDLVKPFKPRYIEVLTIAATRDSEYKTGVK